MYGQDSVIYPAMNVLRACISLTGNIPREASDIEIKCYEDLNQIGHRANNLWLLYENMLSETVIHFYSRNFARVVQLSEEFPPGLKVQRFNEIFFFYEGIASSWLIRQKGGLPQWIAMSKRSLAKLEEMEALSKWNYINKKELLQAEISYTNGKLELAETFYKASIASAASHRFIHEGKCIYKIGFCLLIFKSHNVSNLYW